MCVSLGILLRQGLVLECHLEVKVAKIVHSLEMALFSTFRVQLQGLVPVFLNSAAEFEANAQVCDSASVSSLCSLGKPSERLLKFFRLVEKQTAEGIHAFDMAIRGS